MNSWEEIESQPEFGVLNPEDKKSLHDAWKDSVLSAALEADPDQIDSDGVHRFVATAEARSRSLAEGKPFDEATALKEYQRSVAERTAAQNQVLADYDEYEMEQGKLRDAESSKAASLGGFGVPNVFLPAEIDAPVREAQQRLDAVASRFTPEMLEQAKAAREAIRGERPVAQLGTDLYTDPALTLDKEEYRKAVAESGASMEAKAKAIADFSKKRKAFAQAAAATLQAAGESPIPGVLDFPTWESRLPREQYLQPPEEKALQYMREMKGRDGFRKVVSAIATGIMQGGVDIASQSIGVAALATQDPKLAAKAAEVSKAAETLGEVQKLEGDLTATGATTAGGMARLGTSMAPAIAGSALTGGGLPAASLLAGAQTTGAQFPSTFSALKEQGKSDEEALRAATGSSLMAGAVTTALTAMGGATGVEALVRQGGKEFAKREIAKRIATGALKEVPEEVLDEAASQIIEAQTVTPDKPVAQVVDEFMATVPDLALQVALLGAGAETFKAITERGGRPQEAGPQPVTPAPDTDFARRAAMEGATEFRDTTAGVPVVVEGVTIATIPPESDLSPDDVAAFAGMPDGPTILKRYADQGRIVLPEIVKPVEGVDPALTDEMNQNIAAGAIDAPATVKALEEAQARYEAEMLAQERQAAEQRADAAQVPISQQPSPNSSPRAAESVEPIPQRREGESRSDFIDRRDTWEENYGSMRKGGRTHNDDGTPYRPTIFDETAEQVMAARMSMSGEEALDAIGDQHETTIAASLKSLLDAGWTWDAAKRRMVPPAGVDPNEKPLDAILRLQGKEGEAKTTAQDEVKRSALPNKQSSLEAALGLPAGTLQKPQPTRTDETARPGPEESLRQENPPGGGGRTETEDATGADAGSPAATPTTTEESVKLELTPDESGATGAGMKEEIQPTPEKDYAVGDPNTPFYWEDDSWKVDQARLPAGSEAIETSDGPAVYSRLPDGSVEAYGVDANGRHVYIGKSNNSFLPSEYANVPLDKVFSALKGSRTYESDRLGDLFPALDQATAEKLVRENPPTSEGGIKPAPQPITPTGEEPTDSLPADQPTSGDVGVQRDLTKPEQMTLEQFEASKRRRDKAPNIFFDVPLPRSQQAEMQTSQVGETYGSLTGVHRGLVSDAIEDRKPVLIEAADAYGWDMPEGYVRQGELYVFQPTVTTATETPSNRAKVAGVFGVPPIVQSMLEEFAKASLAWSQARAAIRDQLSSSKEAVFLALAEDDFVMERSGNVITVAIPKGGSDAFSLAGLGTALDKYFRFGDGKGLAKVTKKKGEPFTITFGNEADAADFMRYDGRTPSQLNEDFKKLFQKLEENETPSNRAKVAGGSQGVQTEPAEGSIPAVTTATVPPAATESTGEVQPAKEGEARIIDSVKDADLVLRISKGRNYYTLWFARKGFQRGYNTYLTVLSTDLAEAREKAVGYLRQIASGEKLSIAFAGKKQAGLQGAKTVALDKGVLTGDELETLGERDTTPIADKPIGFGKYAGVLLKDIIDTDFGYATWLADSARENSVREYLNERPEILEMRQSAELEKERVKAFEEREAKRKEGKTVPVATLVRGDEGVITAVEEPIPEQKKAPKLKSRKAAEQIVEILPPQSAADRVSPSLKPAMFQSQIDGANATIDSMVKNGVALNSDGAGVGKTRQIIAVADYFAKQGKPVVIISENAALGKPWEGRKIPVLGGSMAKDSQTMGVPLKLLTETPKPGEIVVSTYNRIEAANVPPGAVVIFDESQWLANTYGNLADQGKEARKWQEKFRAIIPSASSVAYYTATPADKPHQLAYLHKVLGFGTPEEYLDEARRNGVVIIKSKYGGKEVSRYDVPFSQSRKKKLYQWLNNLIAQSGKEGRVIKREISYEGTDVQFHDTKGTDSGKNPWAEKFNDVVAELNQLQSEGWSLLNPTGAILYAAELAKIGDTVNIVKREIAAGRKAVVFFSRVNPFAINGRKYFTNMMGEREPGPTEELGSIPSPLEFLMDELRKEGISFAELHSKSKTTSQKAQKEFASDKDVLIASVESGGTGINLDDSTGKNPRTEVFMYYPYRGISTIQAMGRIWRASTVQDDNKPNRFVFITASDIGLDASRSAVLAKKLQLMNATLGGTAVSKLPLSKVSYNKEQLAGIEIADDMDESTVFQDRYGTLKPVKVNWTKTKAGDRYWSKASADLLEWWERGGPERTGLDVEVFKSKDSGDWIALAGENYPPESFVEKEAPAATESPPAAPRNPAENLVSFTAANGLKLVGEVQSVTGNKATVAYQWNGKTKTQVVPVSQLGSPVASVATPPKYLYNQEQNTRKLGKHFPTSLGVHANHDFRKSFASMAEDTSLSQIYRMVAKVLAKMPEFEGIDLHLVADENIKYAGEYSWNNGKPSIAINLRYLGRGKVDALGSILHEALHHVTLAKVRNPQGAYENEVVGKLDAIREKVIKYAESRGLAKALDYELGSLEEFITAIFTRPDFQAFLASIPESEAAAVTVGKFRSILSEIFRRIAELVTGKPVLRGSALEQAMTTSLALFNTPFRGIETGGLEALNAARSYAGERAQMPQFMRDSLETAQAMAAAGKTSEEIRAVTGWFPGKYDGKMRWEIPDEGATLRLDEFRKSRTAGNSPEEVVRKFFSEKQARQQDEALAFAKGMPKEQLLEFSRDFTARKKAENAALYEFFVKGDNKDNGRVPLGYILDHPALFEAYPELQWVPVSFSASDASEDATEAGSFNPSTGVLFLSPLGFSQKGETLSTALHEIQHWIQGQEGFAKGGNAEAMRKMHDFIGLAVNKANLAKSLREVADLQDKVGGFSAETIPSIPEDQLGIAVRAWDHINERWIPSSELRATADKLDKQILDIDITGYGAYRRLAGEIEARDVQARQRFTPEQRKAVAPYSSENIAKEDAIVMFGGDGAQASMGKGLKALFPQTGDKAAKPSALAEQWWAATTRQEARAILEPASLEELKAIAVRMDENPNQSKAKLIDRLVQITGAYADAVGIRGADAIGPRGPMPDYTGQKMAAQQRMREQKAARAQQPKERGLPAKAKPRTPEEFARDMAALMARPVSETKPVNLSAAYQKATIGKSSQWVTIKEVYEQAKADNPSLTPEAFMAQIEQQNESGGVMISPVENVSTVEAARPFVVGNAGVEMLVPGGTAASRIDEETDAEYLAAVEAGDMEKAQAMVDAAAKAAVKPLSIKLEGKGTSSNGWAVSLGNRTVRIFRDPENGYWYFSDFMQKGEHNPISTNKEDAVKFAIERLEEEMGGAQPSTEVLFRDWREDKTIILPGYYLRFGELPVGGRSSIGNQPGLREQGISVLKAWRSPDGVFVISSATSETGASDMVAGMEERPIYIAYGEDTGEVGSEGEPLLKNVILTEQVMNNRVVVDDPSYISQPITNNVSDFKDWETIDPEPDPLGEAAPVTYDEQGNVIPLSQRFNPESPSVAYSRIDEGEPPIDIGGVAEPADGGGTQLFQKRRTAIGTTFITPADITLQERRSQEETLSKARKIIAEEVQKDEKGGRAVALERFKIDTSLPPEVRAVGTGLIAQQADLLANLEREAVAQQGLDRLAEEAGKVSGIISSDFDHWRNLQLAANLDIDKMAEEAGRTLNIFNVFRRLTPEGFLRRMKRQYNDTVRESMMQNFDIPPGDVEEKVRKAASEKPKDPDKAAKELIKKLKPKPRAPREKIEKALKALFTAAETGALDSQEFFDALGEALGHPPLTAEQQAKIKKLTREINALPKGAARVDKQQELDEELALWKGIAARDVLLSAWYANILSGISTQGIGLFGNLVNFIPRSLFLAATNPRSANAYFQGAFGEGLKTGLREAAAALKGRGLYKVSKYGDKNMVSALELLRKKGPATLPEWIAYIASGGTRLRYVFRIMQAIDALAWNTAREGQAYLAAHRALLNQQRADGVKRTPEEFYRALIDNLGGDAKQIEEDMRTARETLIALGQTPDLLTVDRMAREARNARRSSTATKLSNRFADRIVMQQDPEGIGDVISSIITVIQKKGNFMGVPFGQLLIPFNKIVANLFEQSLDYTPVGALRSYFGGHLTDIQSIDWRGKVQFKDKAVQFDAVERAERMAASVTGTLAASVMFALASLFKDEPDEDVPFMLYGFGPESKNKRDQMPKGWTPYSAKIGDTYIKFSEMPFGVMFAAAGNALDAMRYKNMDKKSSAERLAYVLKTSAKGFTEQGVLSSFDTALEVLTFQASDKKFTDVPVNVAKGMVPAQGMLRDLSVLFDPVKIKDDTISAALLRDFPVVRRIGTRPALNVFGEPVTFDGRIPFVRRIATVREEHAAADYLGRNRLSVPGMAQTIVVGQYLPKDMRDRIQRRALETSAMENGVFTVEQDYNFRKRAGELTKVAVENLMKQVPTITSDKQRENVQKLINKKVEIARRRAMLEAVPAQ